MNKDAKIYVAGHNGMVGSAILRRLKVLGFSNFVLKSSKELDLLRQKDVEDFFEKEKPEYVILAAAKVGGIKANNTFRADFLFENLMIQNNVIHAAFANKVKKLIFLGSSCIYPKNAPQPLKEEYLLTGLLEETNEPYAIAKIAGIKLCENYFRQFGCNFISLMPTNMFGQNDNYDLETSHVIPAILRKIHLAKALEESNFELLKKDLQYFSKIELNFKSNLEIEKFLSRYGIFKQENNTVEIKLWGSGLAFREFMDVDTFANSSIEVLLKVDAQNLYNEFNKSHINIGTGEQITIFDLANKMKEIIDFKGVISWSNDEFDGTLRKCMDISLLEKIIGKMNYNLDDNLQLTYQKYLTYE